MKTFSSRLISLRKERQMTQSDLAKAIKRTRSTVSGYETEDKEPDYELLCSLANFFGVSTDYLLGLDDCRTHSEAVFINDTRNFKHHYDGLPPLVKQVVAKMYDSFYVLLSRDMAKNNEERLEIYSDLFSLLQDSRAKIRNSIDSCTEQVTDVVFLAEIMNLQNSLKNEMCALLDKLIQADINDNLNSKSSIVDVYRAARSNSDEEQTIVKKTKFDMDKLSSAEHVLSDDDL